MKILCSIIRSSFRTLFWQVNATKWHSSIINGKSEWAWSSQIVTDGMRFKNHNGYYYDRSIKFGHWKGFAIFLVQRCRFAVLCLKPSLVSDGCHCLWQSMDLTPWAVTTSILLLWSLYNINININLTAKLFIKITRKIKQTFFKLVSLFEAQNTTEYSYFQTCRPNSICTIYLPSLTQSHQPQKHSTF